MKRDADYNSFMFLGVHKVQVRAKNRIAFPAKLRKQTGDLLFVTNWFENSLLVLPKAKWDIVIKEVFDKASFLLPEVRDLDRFIFGGTFEVELDQEGRFILPKYLKEYAKIKKNAVFVGGMWYIQLWDEKLFENHRIMNQLQIKQKAISLFKILKEKND
ncbi:MAG: hypothetical protein Q7T54_01185 [Candidatus Levybacteria bacterium]|nr:hypothetical protein [Candidatus Levybacteria bacterium]